MSDLLIYENKEVRISSVELVEVINNFRELERCKLPESKLNKPLRHDNFMNRIKKEINVLESLGLNSQGNFKESSYINSQNKTQPCYSLNRDGMLQMLNSESVLVRHKTIEYINKLEDENKQLKEQLDIKANLLLSIYNGGQEGVLASKKLADIEVREATKPLLDKIEEDKPLVEFTETVLKSSDNILVRELAKIACDEGIKIGQNKLYEKLRSWGYIFKKSTEPYQQYVDKGYFVVKETTSKTPYGVRLNKTTLITPLGQIKIIEKLRKEFCKVA